MLETWTLIHRNYPNNLRLWRAFSVKSSDEILIITLQIESDSCSGRPSTNRNLYKCWTHADCNQKKLAMDNTRIGTSWHYTGYLKSMQPFWISQLHFMDIYFWKNVTDCRTVNLLDFLKFLSLLKAKINIEKGRYFRLWVRLRILEYDN